ncbi:MAG: hypothetical protein ACRDAM_10380 [Casimicrobium sp.]
MMKRKILAGIRHAPMPPLACTLVRDAARGTGQDAPLTLATLATRALWMMLVAEHVDRYREAPADEDCEAYQLLAEVAMGDAIDLIDERLRDAASKYAHVDDALLTEAREMKRYTDEIMQAEASRAKDAVADVRSRAERYAKDVVPE